MMINFICCLLIALGICMHFASILCYNKLKDNLLGILALKDTKIDKILKAYQLLLFFFIICYFKMIFVIYYSPDTVPNMIISILLFFCAIFILFSQGLQKTLIENVIQAKMQQIDTFTGLLNKCAFELKVSKIMIERSTSYMIVADYDNFKLINDTYGHSVGDLAIKKGAEIIRNHIHVEDVLARFGGDEFVIYAVNWERKELCETLDKINEETSKWWKLNYSNLNLSFSFGLALQDTCCDYLPLFNKADEAMYKAKANGESNYYVEDTGYKV